MQQQVSDAVRLFVGTPPNLLVLEQAKTAFDLRQKIFRQMILGLRDESPADVTHGSVLTSIPLPIPVFPGAACVLLCVPPDVPCRQVWLAPTDDRAARAVCELNQ